MRPFVTGIRIKQIAAPIMMPNPIGRDRTPTPIGSLPMIQLAYAHSAIRVRLTINIVDLSRPEEQ
jgi:hypothetical protein